MIIDHDRHTCIDAFQFFRTPRKLKNHFTLFFFFRVNSKQGATHPSRQNGLIVEPSQLEGTVNKIKALTIYTNESPSISMAQRIIKEIIIENHPAEITVDRILQEVAAAFDVTADDIKSTNRRANVSLARKIAIYIFKDVKGMTFIQIGNVLNKNHSTMTIHYQDVVKNLKENKQLKDTVDDIIKNLKDN